MVTLMSLQEVIEFWKRFCERERVSLWQVERGIEEIKHDPDYWASKSMWKLWEATR